jgi:hypothetical protein
MHSTSQHLLDDHATDPRHERWLVVCGLIAVACYAAHAAFHTLHGRWYDALWSCHVAAMLVGVGLLTGRPTVNAVGVLLGCMGLPLWLLDLAGGGELFPTSILTHVVALLIGLYGVSRLGMPRGAWWKATATLVALIGLCRLLTPPEANVNVAFAIQRGWERQFASHASYLGFTIAAATAYFFFVERLLRCWRPKTRVA